MFLLARDKTQTGVHGKILPNGYNKGGWGSNQKGSGKGSAGYGRHRASPEGRYAPFFSGAQYGGVR